MWPFETSLRDRSTQRSDPAGHDRGRRSRGPVAAALAVTAIVLAACAGAGSANPAAAASDLQLGGSDAAGVTVLGAPEAGTGGVSGDPAASAAPVQSEPGDPLPEVDLIVRTGTMTVEVPAIDAALLRAKTAIAGLGGYISASDQTNDGDQTIASVTYRFPAARWDDAQTAISGIATKVVTAKTGSSEVTGQVLDLGARIANLQATESALQAIMAKATKIPDILEVQNQLTTVQGQIEELSTEEAHLRDQASLATLTVLFQTPAVAVVSEVSKGWDVGAELDKAAAQLLSVGQVLATAGIWLVVVGLPVFGGTLVILLIALFVARRLVRRLAPGFARYAAPTDLGGGPGA